jgi:hypothetical protein
VHRPREPALNVVLTSASVGSGLVVPLRPGHEVDQRFCWSEAIWWAWEDLNLRLHPYQGSAHAPVSAGSSLQPARTTYRWRPLETVANRWVPMACGPNVDRPRHAARGQRRSASRPLPGTGQTPSAGSGKHFPLVCHVVREALTECRSTAFWPPSPISADSSRSWAILRWLWRQMGLGA